MYSIRHLLFNTGGKLMTLPLAICLIMPLLGHSEMAFLSPPTEIEVSSNQFCIGDNVELSFSGAETVFYWGLSFDGGTSYPVIDSTFQNPFSFQITENTFIRLDLRDEFDNSSYLYLDLQVIEPHLFSCPSNGEIQLELDLNCEVEIPNFLDLQESAVIDNVLVYIQNPPAGPSNPSNTIEINYTGICGEPVSCSVEIQAIDNTSPTITCPSDITVELPPLSGTIEVELAIPDVSGECSMFSLVNDIAGTENVIQFPIGSTSVEWTVTDAFGNSSSCITEVQVVDVSPPSYSYCPDTLHFASNSDSCEGWVEYTPLVEDNVGIFSHFNNLGYLPGDSILITTGVYDLIWTAEDISGLISTCETHIVIDDVFAPNIICPPDINLQVSSGACSVVVDIPAPFVEENCGIQDIWSIPSGPQEEFGVGTTTITYYASDYELNISQCETQVIVVDVHPPVIYCPSTIQAITTEGSCTVLVEAPTVMVTDNCNVNTYWNELNNGMSLPATLEQGNYTVTWSATDINGNQSSCFSLLTVSDLTGPVLSCPSELTLYLDSNCSTYIPDLSYLANSAFDCTGIASFTQIPSANSMAQGQNAIEITTTDIWGNESSCEIHVLFEDTIAPIVLNCLADITQSLNTDCEFVVPDYRSMLSVIDNCTDNPDITQIPASGTLFIAPGQYPIEFVIEDESGNQSLCQFVISIEDQLAPVIEIIAFPDDLYLDLNCEVIIPDLSSFVNVDNECTDILSIVQSPEAGVTMNSAGTQSVTITATDESGNSSQTEFTIQIIDTIAPILSVSINQLSLYLDNNCETEIPSLESYVSSSDNCLGITNYSQYPTSGTILSGTSTVNVEITITDSSGNESSEFVLITVVDNEAPIITCNPQQIYELTGDLCAELVQLDIPDVQENCSLITLTNDLTAETFEYFAGPGNYPITWFANDESGNQSSCISELIIIDNSAPVISCPEDVAYCEDLIFIETPPVFDNCGIQSVEMSHADWISSGVFPFGETVITVTATDINGNISECEFSIFHYNPEQCCPTPTNGGVLSTPVQNHYCEGETITVNASGFTGDPIWQYSSDGVLWFDNTTGNSDTYSFELNGNTWVRLMAQLPFCEIAYSDTLYFETFTLSPPICLPYLEEAVDGNCEFTLPDFASIWSEQFDNSDFEFSQTPNLGTILSIGSHSVELTVEAYCGISETCTFEIAVADQTAPNFSGDWPLDLVLPLSENCEMNLPTDLLTYGSVNDNCTSIDNISLEIADITSDEALHQVHLIIQAIDESGNASLLNWTIQFIDQTAPQLDCIASMEVPLDLNCEALIPDLSEVISFSDNCSVSSYTQIPNSGTIVSSGIHNVEFIVSDFAGISSSCIVEINTVDEIAPVINCQEDFVVYVNEFCQGMIPDLTNLVSVSDECTYQIQQVPSAGTYINEDILVSLFALDPSGNQSSCEILITLIDTIAGSLLCPDNITTYLSNDLCESIVNYEVEYNDNCTGVWPELQQGPLSGTSLETGIHEVIWTALENGTELHTCSFTITVLDTIAPILPPDLVIHTCDAIAEFEVPELIEPCYASFTRIDNNGFNQGDVLPPGTTEFIYVAIDASGNSDTTHITFLVESPGILEFNLNEIAVCNNADLIVLYDYINSNIDWVVTTSGMENGTFNPINFEPGTYTLNIENESGFCDVFDSMDIVVHENGYINFSSESAFCGTEAQFELSGNCQFESSEIFPAGNVFVSTDLSECSVEVPSIGDYLIEIHGQTEHGCSASIELELEFMDPVLSISAGEDIDIYQAQTMDLTGIIDGAGTGTWTLLSGNAEILSTNGNAAQVQIDEPGESYFMFSAEDNMCGTISDSLLITLHLLDIPNTITPNNDGINDNFFVPGADRENCKIMINDRWGYTVYKSNVYENNWPTIDTNQPAPESDVYYYQIEMGDQIIEGFFMVKND
jgi:gliding motility-associated-like protein